MLGVAARALLLCALVPGVALLLGDLAPGDPLADVRLDPSLSPDALARLRSTWGIDDPLPVRYLHWIGGAFQGDLGTSFRHQAPVWTLVQPRMANTLRLTVPATLLAWAVGVPLGIWSAASRRGRVDRIIGGATVVLLATPELLLALGLVALALVTGWLPVAGMRSVEGDAGPADALAHLVLPVTVLALGLLPTVTRHVRSAMQEALASPSLVAARARGLPARRVLWRHALPLASAPLATLLGLSAATILSASLAVEAVFDWPGMGTLLLEATLAHDGPVVAAVTTLSSLLLSAGVLAGHALGALVDPRLSREDA
ncbi:transporter [Luteitalea sp. TBR-22]|nr:transporter [Luteitalea sp. TBR-22]